MQPAHIIVICGLLASTLSSKRVERQVSFGFPFLTNQNSRPLNVQLGGNNPQNNAGGLVNSFLGGLFGNQAANPQPTQPSGNQNTGGFPALNQFFRPGGFGNLGFGPCANNGGCQHKCEVIGGTRRRCQCNQGYVLKRDFRTCSDLNECNLTLNPVCSDICLNTPGSYECHCNGDGVLLADKKTCRAPTQEITPATPKADCSVNNGGCQDNCSKRRGRIICSCKKGFHLESDGKTCTDIDECTTGKATCPSTCINTPGSYACGSTVADPTCDVNNGGCEQTCKVKANGRIACSCQRNYKLRNDHLTCQLARDPCSRNNGRCQHECIFENNQKTCKCREGFELVNRRRCRQKQQTVNPCQRNNGGCQHSCNHIAGKAECSCREGFQLINNNKCRPAQQPRDPCQRINGGCDQICTNANGNVVCSCEQGFDLLPDNIKCQAKQQQQPDPCQRRNGRCQHICTNVNGGAVCSCQSGYELINGKRCREKVAFDPCAAVRCAHKCRNLGGHAECYCNHGFYLENGQCLEEDAPFILPVRPPKPPTIPDVAHEPSIPQVESCGINPKKSLIRRIVGGKPASPGDWPWMAALLMKTASTNFCGGVLIAPQIVLTAAHCVHPFTKEEIKVRLGEYEFTSKTPTAPAIDIDILELRSHEEYNTETQQNDIALVKLEYPVQFNPSIFPVCLPDVGDNYSGQRGYVTGWGTIHFGGPSSKFLQEVIIPVWEDEKCKNAYTGKIHPGMMCAGLPEGGKDSCQGDSGGPYLMQKFPSTAWFVSGVVSWGVECASPERPGVYTKVNEYLDWIAAHSH